MVLDAVGAHGHADAVERVDRALGVHGRGVHDDAPGLHGERGKNRVHAHRQVLQAARHVQHVAAARVAVVGGEAELRGRLALDGHRAAALDHAGHVAHGPAQGVGVAQHAPEGVVLDADVPAQVEHARQARIDGAAQPEEAGIVVEIDLRAVELARVGIGVADGLAGRRAGLGRLEALERPHEEVLVRVVQELAPVGAFAGREGQQA
ncbi:hypothetical protein D9M69_507930 [compost metagenome]